MALVAEYSMVRAKAFQLEQSIREKEAELERCNINLEKGEAPSAEIEQEWLRAIRDDERKNEREGDVKNREFIEILRYLEFEGR